METLLHQDDQTSPGGVSDALATYHRYAPDDAWRAVNEHKELVNFGVSEDVRLRITVDSVILADGHVCTEACDAAWRKA